MPFIWDDSIYFMVSDKKEYDKKRFVIVRKLFVRPRSMIIGSDNDINVSKSICFIEKYEY